MHKRIKILFTILLCSIRVAIAQPASQPINIWDGTDCKANVKLTPYLANGNNNIACIVCPGGSYFWLDKKTEGVGVAEWLQANGMLLYWNIV